MAKLSDIRSLVVIAALLSYGQFQGFRILSRNGVALPTYGWDYPLSLKCSSSSSPLKSEGLGERYGTKDYSLFLMSLPAPGQWPYPLNEPLWSFEARGNVTLTTCIPALARAIDDNLDLVLSSVQNQTSLADEVAIVISEVPTDLARGLARHPWCRDVLAKARSIVRDIPLRVVCIGDRLTAGMARNVLARVASGDVLSFIDVDDEEYTVRNEVVRNMFECYRGQLNLLTHGYSDVTRPVHPYEWVQMREFDTARGVALHGVPPNAQCADQDKVETVYGDQMYEQVWSTHLRWKLFYFVADGHMVVHRRVFQNVKFTTSMKGEDTMFIRDIVLTHGNNRTATMCLNRPLTWYHGLGMSNQDLAEREQKMKRSNPELYRWA